MCEKFAETRLVQTLHRRKSAVNNRAPTKDAQSGNARGGTGFNIRNRRVYNLIDVLSLPAITSVKIVVFADTSSFRVLAMQNYLIIADTSTTSAFPNWAYSPGFAGVMAVFAGFIAFFAAVGAE